jgi:hypothetical protein
MRVPVLLFVLPLLAGCTDADWDNVMSFGGIRDRQEVAEAAAPAPAPAPAAAAAPASNAFCLGVARQDATGNDFDQATQQRVAQQSYQQCVAIFGGQD